MIDVLVIFGPNLNMLGKREPQTYGSHTMADIMFLLEAKASGLSLEIAMMQSKDESELVTTIQNAQGTARAIPLNLAAYTHTSVALRNVIAIFGEARVEVHLSNNCQRESFRQVGLTATVSNDIIVGFGTDSFLLNLDSANRLFVSNVDGDHKLVRHDRG